MQISDSVVLVTGGASGLGAATVMRLHGLGAKTIVCDLNDEAGTRLAEGLNGTSLFVRTDVTSENSVQRAIEKGIAEFGPIRAVVNCAGILLGEKILGKESVHDLGRFRKVIDVNLVGTFNVIRLAANAMQGNQADQEGERGVIVNTASIAAFEGQFGQSAYAASKAGIVGLTLPAARELARYGIRVCAIAPGIFDTSMLAGLPDKIREALAAQVPFPPRLGRPEEYALTVEHILQNRLLNGTTIRLDGAMRMAAK